MTLRRHSVSACSEYERCPRRYRYGYVDRLPHDRPVPAAWRHGTVVHHALETAYRARQDGAPLVSTIPGALEALDDAWMTEGLPDDAAWRARSRDMLRTTLAEDQLDTSDILGVEQGFRATLPSGRYFAGYADLVLRRDDETIEIVDHKITKYARTADELATNPQLNLYGWFAQREWPWARRVLASHHYPVLDQVVTVELSQGSMQSTVDRLDAIAAHADADREFPPTPGPECSSCPWFSRCPAQQSGLDVAGSAIAV